MEHDYYEQSFWSTPIHPFTEALLCFIEEKERSNNMIKSEYPNGMETRKEEQIMQYSMPRKLASLSFFLKSPIFDGLRPKVRRTGGPSAHALKGSARCRGLW